MTTIICISFDREIVCQNYSIYIRERGKYVLLEEDVDGYSLTISKDKVLFFSLKLMHTNLTSN